MKKERDYPQIVGVTVAIILGVLILAGALIESGI